MTGMTGHIEGREDEGEGGGRGGEGNRSYKIAAMPSFCFTKVNFSPLSPRLAQIVHACIGLHVLGQPCCLMRTQPSAQWHQVS